MKYKAVIFDLDGTLLDTIDDLADSMNAVLIKHGFAAHPVHKYRYYTGSGMERLVRAAIPDGCNDEKLIAEMYKELRNEYGMRQNDKTKPYDGINELLTGLQNRGVNICVLSNKPDDFTRLIVKRFFPDCSWSVIYGQRPDVPAKPHPAGAFDIVSELDLNCDEVLYAGDTGIDMKTAKSAGMFAVGVLWGFRTKTELAENGADKIIADPAELLALLD